MLPHAWGYLCTPQPDLDTTGEGGGVHNTLNVIGCQLMQEGAVVSGGTERNSKQATTLFSRQHLPSRTDQQSMCCSSLPGCTEYACRALVQVDSDVSQLEGAVLTHTATVALNHIASSAGGHVVGLRLHLRSPEGIRALQKDDVASLGRPQGYSGISHYVIDHVMRKP